MSKSVSMAGAMIPLSVYNRVTKNGVGTGYGGWVGLHFGSKTICKIWKNYRRNIEKFSLLSNRSEALDMGDGMWGRGDI